MVQAGGDSYSPDQDLIPWLLLIQEEDGELEFLCQGAEKASLDASYPASAA